MIEFGIKNGDEVKAVIRIFKESDVTTLPHELAHYFRRTLNAKEMMEAEKIFGKFVDEGADAAEEKFANAFVKYLSEGEAPTEIIKSVFEKFKTWITDTWKALKENNPDEVFELTQAHKDFFDAIMGDQAKAKELFGEVRVKPKTTTDTPLSNEADELFQTEEAGKIINFVRKVFNTKDNKVDEIVISKPTSLISDFIKDNFGVDLGGFTRYLDNYSIKHIFKQHGDPVAEAKRGQIAITENDITLYDDITSNPDNIAYGGKTPQGRDTIAYMKKYGDKIYVIEEIRTKRNKLIPTTMWKMKATTPNASGFDWKPAPRSNAQSVSSHTGTIPPKDLKESELSKQEWEANLAEWHKDSHPLTKNEDGTPKVFYHGTKADFDTFANELLGSSTKARTASAGHYFTDNADIASQYAKDGNVMPVHIDMKKPFVIDTANPSDAIAKAITNIKTIHTPDSFNAFKQFVKDTTAGDYKAIKEHLQKQGYDGIVLKDTQDILSNGEKIDMVPHDSFVTFEPTQIKSIHNRGTFNPENPNILYQAWGSSDKDIDKLLGIPQELTSFGRNYSQFKDNPKEAIAHLIKVKNGQVRGALYHNDIGEIDLVWGKVLDKEKHTGYGLAHIIDKHGESIARRLDDIIMGGKVVEKKGNRVILQNNDAHGVVILDFNNKDKKWVMTAYEPERQTLADVSTMAGKSDNLSPKANVTIPPKDLKENKLSKQEWEANPNILYQAVRNGKNENITVDDIKETFSQNRGIYQDIEYSKENWDKAFPDGKIQTPLGEIKMGENQFDKLDPDIPDPKNPNRTKQDRRGHLSYIEQTLKEPTIILKKDDGSMYFFKEFDTPVGTKSYASITLNKDQIQIAISSYGMKTNQILKEIKNGNVVYLSSKATTNEAALSVSHPAFDTADAKTIPQNKSDVNTLY